MDRKKKLVYFVSLFLFNIFLLSIVSAYNGFSIDLRRGSEQVIDIVIDFAEPFLQIILGGEDYTGLLLFERFLIFILLLSIIYLSLKNITIFEDTPIVLWIVSVIVPLVAIRFINFEWLNTILLSYQILGIAIAGILPFIIYLFFLHNITESSTARKIGWVFFIVLYFGLWSTNQSENYAQIYFWTMLVALVFLLLDGTIHRAFEKQKWKETGREAIEKRIIDVGEDLKKAEISEVLSPKEKRKIVKKDLEEIKRLRKLMGKV